MPFVVLPFLCVLCALCGQIQAEEGVVHLVAETLWRPRLGRDVEGARSRDFH